MSSASSAHPHSTSAMEAQHLAVHLGGRSVLHDMVLRVPRGSITALVGPNGSGKSTILRALARLLRPQRGEVLLDGRDLRSLSSKEVARRLAVLPQAASAPSAVTVEELVGYGRHPHQRPLRPAGREDQEAVRWALEATGLTPLADRAVDTLSGGERQRAWIAMALAQKTGLLLLDEPTTYLDIRYQLDILTLVRRLNQEHDLTVVWVLHDLNHAAHYSDHLVFLREGRIVAEGEPQEVVRPGLIHRVFDVDVTVIPHPITGAPTCLSVPASAASAYAYPLAEATP